MPRFVLLLHECPQGVPRPTHCDLMLETGESLETWALAELPQEWQSLLALDSAFKFAKSNSVAAERLADHRCAYLNYEGPVSGDRGTVSRLDAGTYSLGQNAFAYELKGQAIRGRVELHHSLGADHWQLTVTPTPS